MWPTLQKRDKPILSQETVERLLLIKSRNQHRAWTQRPSGTPNAKNCWGLGKEGRKELEEAQESKCFLCGEYSFKLQLDHDHSTKQARKLLCSRCNSRLGLFESWIRAADIDVIDIALYLQNGDDEFINF